ncbi:alpha/beta fold hydrolase [Hymenobacter sp.]|uniref:alpha/beta hydrolase n=1 Tax=Hymenobacter sp. TaxID=1898978 RepID=UPI00286B8D04|nr:alpha/beta fold hydrolase [Hymenobacter sp.]
MRILVIFLLVCSHFVSAQRVDTVRFTSGQNRLVGWLYRPGGVPSKPQPVVLILHSATYGRHDYSLYLDLARELNRMGIAVFSYDRRGNGLSSAKAANTSYTDLAKDGLAALRAVKALPGINTQCVGLYGISQGCWIAAIMNTLDSKASQFTILVSGSTESPSQQMDFAARYHLQAKGVASSSIDSAIRVRNAVDDFYRGKLPYKQAATLRKQVETRKWFADAIVFKLDSVSDSGWKRDMDFTPAPYFRKFVTPTLVLYGEYDEWVNTQKGLKDWPSWQLPRLSLHSIPGANHLMLVGRDENPARPVVAGRYHQLIRAWVAGLACRQ